MLNLKFYQLSRVNYILFCVLFGLGLSSCVSTWPKEGDVITPDVIITGNDRDAQNCIATAGYTWSDLYGKCLRLFEAGTALTDVQNPEATSVAYVILDPILERGELYLPDRAEDIKLIKEGNEWKAIKEKFTLTEKSGKPYQLLGRRGKVLYQIEK